MYMPKSNTKHAMALHGHISCVFLKIPHPNSVSGRVLLPKEQRRDESVPSLPTYIQRCS